MTGHEKGLLSPLKRVRGLGASHNGAHHWWQTRLASMALVPLTLWFILSLMNIRACTGGNFPQAASRGLAIECHAGYQQIVAWAGQPLNALLLILLTIIMFQHAASGIQVVLEDYVHREGRKLVFIYGVKTILLVLGAACVLSILKLALGHPT